MDDDFSDEDFLDQIDESDLQKLEENAIQLTQVQAQAQVSQRPPPLTHQHQHHQPQPQPQLQQQHVQQDSYGLDEDDDLDDTVVFEEIAQQSQPGGPKQTNSWATKSLPVQQARLNANLANTQRWNQHIPLPTARPVYPPPPKYPQVPSSRPIPYHAPPSLRPVPPARPLPPPRPQHAPTQSQFARPPVPPVPRPYSVQPSHAGQSAPPGPQGDIIAQLQSQLAAAQSELATARGEALIIRSKYDKIQNDRDFEVARLRKLHEETLAKHERELNDFRATTRNVTTELQFAQQDLREGLGRGKSRKKDGASTPKKNHKFWGQADGFNDVEVVSSPTKGSRRRDAIPTIPPAGERTPSKGGKRKRGHVFASPKHGLEVDENALGSDRGATREVITPTIIISTANALPYDFLRLVLDHSALRDQPPTFDLFSRFTFPSDPSQTFSTVIFQKLSRLGSPKEPLLLLADFAELVIDLWQRCLSERYHAPIYYLASLVLYTLDLNAVVVAPRITSSLVPVCTTTCQLIALQRHHSPDGDLSNHADPAIRQLSLDIDVTQCLALLYLAALGCAAPARGQAGAEETAETTKHSPLVQFWRTVEPEFVLRMLSVKHPERDWYGMLSLLWTSVLPDSIGPIPSPVSATSTARSKAKDLDQVSKETIKAVSLFLNESPRWAPKGSVKELEVRTATLRTLVIFTSSPYGMVQAARSEVVIPRLVTVLCWAIDRLYDLDGGLPAIVQNPAARGGIHSFTNEVEADDPDGQDGEKEKLASLLPRFIARAILLLHTLVTHPRTADVVQMGAKLSASHGGSQRYLLTLARLCFAEEELVLEAGIDPATAELARELIELSVTPVEGEEMSKAFG
ncbi:Putative protein similar to UVS-3 of Neurospora crassa [Podospora comata]|uniref:DNA repair protein Rad26 n=1 Tax=Podospora comata TaxID=48703 RepID=A0ABY6S4X7_PODCO|nr:Putative protein similar to UVS-3 of Neurospora crassa [Podospora comata]